MGACNSPRIVVVTKDPSLEKTACGASEAVGLVPEVSAKLEDALRHMPTERIFGLIVDIDGGPEDSLAGLRSTGAALPAAFFVLVATNLPLDEEIKAFRCGADHCFRKPLPKPLLQARIEALLDKFSPLRQRTPSARLRQFCELEIDTWSHTTSYLGKPVPLTPTEYKVLELLSRTPGKPVRYEAIGSAVWGWDSGVYQVHIKCHISRLRSKLERAKCGARIKSIRGMGYALNPKPAA